MVMSGLVRVTFVVDEVKPVVPPVEIPIVRIGDQGCFVPWEDQRHIVVSLSDRLFGKTHDFALDRLAAMKLRSDLADALEKLANCHEC